MYLEEWGGVVGSCGMPYFAVVNCILEVSCFSLHDFLTKRLEDVGDKTIVLLEGPPGNAD